jgi:hypothetical protein
MLGTGKPIQRNHLDLLQGILCLPILQFPHVTAIAVPLIQGPCMQAYELILDKHPSVGD